ncbi:hypothetical protein SAMN05421780_102111 [Flexibacter flexilis DSM 6793]|uniref:STAS domain-containing protein n=1 Tax=Flexibacter flexilis DSM 6793 TaxID=927664 RepID=A0A1I1FAC3_9BACT|nr:hypothetical protein [Flexibacter flexilis]SFB96244.1 hypothetical protein SAMN05421780_102111 [Flexibacter flexilis DSM 6793]
MEFAEIDQTRLPILIFRNNPIIPPIQEYETYLVTQKRLMQEAIEEKRKVIVIMDLTNLKFMNSEMRIKRGNFIKEHEKLMQESLSEVILVAPNIVSRTMLQGIFLIRKPSVPTFVVANIKEALSKAENFAEKLLAS